MRLSIADRLLAEKAKRDLTEARAIVRELVQANDARGLEDAFARVGEMTGLTPRRIKSFWQGTVSETAVKACELDMLRAAQAAHDRAELARCEQRLAVLRARLGGQRFADDSPTYGSDVFCPAAAMA